MKRLFMALAITFILPAGLAVANTPASAKPSGKTAPTATASATSDGDCARARKAGRACKLTFDGDDIGGDRPAGSGSTVTARSDLPFTNLITVRTSFRDMIIKSASDI